MAEEKKLPIQFGKVVNPTNEDLHFLYDSAEYVLKAGEEQDKWSAHHAKHAAKKLADKNIMTTDPQEHRVLMGAYLSNQEVEVVAKSLGINLVKIRKEAMTKEKEKARVINLEDKLLKLQEKVDAMGKSPESKPEPETVEEVKKEQEVEKVEEVEEKEETK